MNYADLAALKERKAVDFTQLDGFEDFYDNVLRHLTDANAASLSEVSTALRDATYDERLKRKCFTYGAAAVPEMHEEFVQNILGDLNNWKDSKDAMTFVARTFSGAKMDGTFEFDQLHPHLLESSYAFHMVREWWEWMCDNNRDVALKTDILSFLLSTGEAFHAKRHRKVYENVFYEFNVQNIRNNDLRIDFYTGDDIRQTYITASRNVALWKGPLMSFSYKLEDSRLGMTLQTRVNGLAAPEQFIIRRPPHESGPVENPEEVPDLKLPGVSTRLWAHACLDKIASTTELASLYHPDVLQQDVLKSLHVGRVETFHRGGYDIYPKWWFEDSAFIMF